MSTYTVFTSPLTNTTQYGWTFCVSEDIFTGLSDVQVEQLQGKIENTFRLTIRDLGAEGVQPAGTSTFLGRSFIFAWDENPENSYAAFVRSHGRFGEHSVFVTEPEHQLSAAKRAVLTCELKHPGSEASKSETQRWYKYVLHHMENGSRSDRGPVVAGSSGSQTGDHATRLVETSKRSSRRSWTKPWV